MHYELWHDTDGTMRNNKLLAEGSDLKRILTKALATGLPASEEHCGDICLINIDTGEFWVGAEIAGLALILVTPSTAGGRA